MLPVVISVLGETNRVISIPFKSNTHIAVIGVVVVPNLISAQSGVNDAF